MPKEVVVTREGYRKLEEELDNLRTVVRKEVAEKIKVARGYGDLSENAENDAAKEEQGIVEAKINEMDVRELEELVLSVMKNELQTVVNLGAVIGAIIGAVNIFI